MELRARAPGRLTRRAAAAGLAAAALALAGLALTEAPASAASHLRQPASQTRPPAGYRLTARQVIGIASRAQRIRAEAVRRRDFRPTAYTKEAGAWQVSWFDGDREVAQAKVDDRSGAVLEAWTGSQVAWTMARGYPGAFGRKLNAPYVWIPLCLAFLLPFFDPRRPLRLLHLDLLVMLAFGASQVFFNRGEIGVSVPLAYPVLAYLLARLLWIGFRGGGGVRGPLVPLMSNTALVVLLALLVAFRVGLDVADSNVIDVGYAGVIGADRIVDGKALYGPGFSRDVEHGDTYGPVNYLLYVPFEQALGWSGRWDDLPAAHGAALAFDLLTLLALMALGRRIRPGPEGRRLGLALGCAWAAYPYTAFALETNANDSLVALATVSATLALTWAPARPRAAAAGRALAVALGAGAKFVPLALAPLFARSGADRRRTRALPVYLAVLALTLAAAFAPFVPDGGLRELYDRTLGYQAARPSPFSIWGQVGGIGWLHAAVKAAAALLAVGVAVVPRRRDIFATAALAAAVIIGFELAASHWFYLYIVWFAPLAFVALMAPPRRAAGARAAPPAASGERMPVPA